MEKLNNILENIPLIEIFCYRNIINTDSHKKLVYRGDKIIIDNKEGEILEIEYGSPRHHLGRIKVSREEGSIEEYYINDEKISKDWRKLI